MLPKKNRADKKAVGRIFKEGKFINSPNLTFRFVSTREYESFSSKQPDSSLPTRKFLCPRISVIVPKAVAKLAVKRNLLRRLGYSVLEKYINQFPSPLLGVFVFKKYQDNVLILEHEIKNILNKVN